jgi:transmembrane sensor
VSEQHARRRWSTNAEEVQATAGAWIARRDHSDWSTKDQRDLDAWLASSPAHMVAFLRLSDIWQRANRLRALGQPARGGMAFLHPRRVRAFVTKFSMAFAIMALAVAGALIYSVIMPREMTYTTPIGGHRLIVLADGSRIELNTDTVLRIRDSGTRQIASLDRGEAYFQITHNPARNFVVLAGEHRVIDLGTKFLVRSEPNRLEVALIEGRVRFDGRAARSILLKSGDVVVVSGKSIATTRKQSQALASELGWRRGVLVFRHTTLADAAAEFNRYNREKLVVVDNATARLTMDGTFPANNTQAFIRLAQEVFGLRVVNGENEIVISR